MNAMFRFLLSFFLLSVVALTASKADNVPDATELAALKDIYDNLGGASWQNKTNWPTGAWPQTATSADFATWYGIQVVSGDVVGINLSANNLAGTIPASIGNLTGLWSLYLNNNAITGSIPAETGNLSSLFYLLLYGNQLTGALPGSLGNLTNLLQFNADGNQLSGSIPATLGSLSNLTTLSLANNQLSGSIPSTLTGLANISTLYLYANQLTGSIPAGIGSLSNLVYLGLSDNQLSGSVPEGVGSLANLVYLNLGNNGLTGSIPVSIGNASALQNIILDGNALTGTLPATISNLPALYNLSVANNALSGSIPSVVVNMPSLVYLVLQSNDFTFFPDMSSSANRHAIYIYLSDNPLGFGSLEPNVTSSGQSVIDHLSLGSIRQHSLVSYVKADAGSGIVIPVHDPGQHSSITWEKQAPDGSWVNVNAGNEDATQKTFRKSAVSASDGGRYRYRVSNSLITGFIMESASIYVGVGKDVVWNGILGATDVGGILSKTAATGWGNAGAHAENILPASTDGWLEFVVDKSNLTSDFSMGFSAVDNAYTLSSMAFGLEVLTTQRIAVYESSSTGADLTGWVPGDVFRIAREGTSITYYKNGTVIRAVTATPSAYEVKALLHQGTTAPVITSFWIPASRGIVPDAWEFAALKGLYDSLGGSAWKTKTNWPTNGNWVTNITAAQMDTWYGITAGSGDITGIALAQNTLAGKIPQRIGALTSLTVLTLNDNQLTGALPESLGNLTKLTSLKLSKNNFSGHIPASLGNLTKLTWLSLYTNPNLGGSIPASFYNLINLTDLYIFETNIDGSLTDQIGNLNKLVNVWLYNNNLSGALPAALGNITTLTNLYLYGNNFSGPLPDNWQHLTKLKNFWIHYNANLSGAIPTWIGNLTNLETLALGESNMEGTLPASIGNLTKLTELYLWDLNLTGAVPESWQSLTNLTLLQINANALTGPIPAWLVNMPKLKTMNLADCEFTQFPDISARTDKASLIINLQGNRIPVADLERYFTGVGTHLFGTFTYGPQRQPTAIPPLHVPQHQTLSLEGVAGGTHGVYLWEKLTDGTWVNVGSQNQSADPWIFSIPDVSPQAGGTYRYTVTNGWLPDIRYESGSVAVTITDALVTSVKALYNGLISSVRWRTDEAYGTNGDDFSGMYVYDYDNKYQIKDASWATPDFALNTFQFDGNRFRLTGMRYDANGNILGLKRYDEHAARIHNFEYSYQPNTNKLTSVSGYVNTYTYNALGQLSGEDKTEGDDQYVEYDVSGKVTLVYSDPGKTIKKVEYQYDDRGFRLAKINYANNRTTWYIRDASGGVLSVYEQEGIAGTSNTNPAVQTEVPVYGSGKLGLYYPQQDGSTSYEITDHLGNVRALLRENVNTYTATLEDTDEEDITNPRVEELQYFQNLFETAYDDAFMNHTPASVVANPHKVAYLFWNDNAGTTSAEKAIGPAIALKVNAGDEIAIETWTRFEEKAHFTKDFGLIALSALLGNSFVSQGGFEGLSAAQTGSNIEGVLTTAAYPDAGGDDLRPYAYLNYIVYDANMVYKDAGWMRVPTEAGSDPSELYLETNKPVKLAFEQPVSITENGYIYVWVSNQSKEGRVWFDDLSVTQTQNLVVQATDYGVWGDVLREQKADELTYRFGYQGQYAEKDEETGWSHFELREYDPVVGRWTAPDPKGQYWSPYLGMSNNPANSVDPDGAYSKAGAWWRNGFSMDGIYESGGEFGFNTLDGDAIVSHFGDERSLFNFGDNQILDRAAEQYLAQLSTPERIMARGGDGIEPDYTIESFVIPVTNGISLLYNGTIRGVLKSSIAGSSRLGGSAAKVNYYTLKAKKLGYSSTMTGANVKAGFFVQLNHNLARIMVGKATKVLYSNSEATIAGRVMQNEAIRDGLIEIGVGTGSLFYNLSSK